MTSKEPRVLFILPDLTDPPSRGYEVRATSLASELKAWATVELMTGDGEPARAESRQRKAIPVGRILWTVPREWPLQTALYDGPDVAERAVQAALAWKPMVVIVVTERLPYTTIALAKRLPVVLDVVDSMTLHMKERAARSSSATKWFWELEARRFVRLSAAVSKVVRAVIAASPTAQTYYPGAIVIANASNLKRRPRPSPQYDLIFTGNLWYWPNVEAVRILCEEIAPIVRQRLPGARILIAGRNPVPDVRRLAAKSGVTLKANIPDLGELLAASRLALAPIRWTPGANLKILDALAVGTPVVTFRAAAEQLPDASHGIMTCDTAKEMADMAVKVLTDEYQPLVPIQGHNWSSRAALLADMLMSLAD